MATETFTYIRLVAGKATECSITVDENRVLVAETVGEKDMSPPSATPAVAPATNLRQARATLSRWASQSIADNPIPGSDSLRKEFLTEIKEAERRSCSSCQMGSLIRKYKAKLISLKLLPPC